MDGRMGGWEDGRTEKRPDIVIEFCHDCLTFPQYSPRHFPDLGGD